MHISRPSTEAAQYMLSHASRVSSFVSSNCTQHTRRRRVLAGAIALVACAAWAPAAAGAESLPTNCDKVASPQGSDSAAGTAASPLRTAQALTEALAPGQVGCLRAGSYGGGLRLNHGGTAGAVLTLRNYPGEQAQITGRVYVPRGSDYVTIADLSLDGNYQSGSPLPSPTVNANHTTFEGDDVTDDHTEICFDIGSATWGPADSTVIANSRVHDCGLLPSRNQDHGMYIQDATNTQIVGNLIDHNVDRGIQLYPSAQGTVVTDNVISENGENVEFSGAGGVASSNNTVEHNLIVNANIRYDVESWYPAGNPVGTGNIVQNNCVSSRGIMGYGGGFSARSNVTASAGELVATENGSYLPARGSACAGVLPELPRAISAQGFGSGSGSTPAENEGPGGSTHGPASGSGHSAPTGGAHEAQGHGASATPKKSSKHAVHRKHRRRHAKSHRRGHAKHTSNGARSARQRRHG
jgi:parallel beta-helix repeat protein